MKTLPILEYLNYRDTLEDGWESELSILDLKLSSLTLHLTKITNFKILADLCKNGTTIHLHEKLPVFDIYEWMKYFKLPKRLSIDHRRFERCRQIMMMKNSFYMF